MFNLGKTLGGGVAKWDVPSDARGVYTFSFHSSEISLNVKFSIQKHHFGLYTLNFCQLYFDSKFEGGHLATLYLKYGFLASKGTIFQECKTFIHIFY